MSDEPMWNGVVGSHCQGEHRSTGIRAWCSPCGEWCYASEEGACRGCLTHEQGFNLDVRDDLVVSNITRYRTGTIQITLKPRE